MTYSSLSPYYLVFAPMNSSLTLSTPSYQVCFMINPEDCMSIRMDMKQFFLRLSEMMTG